MKGECELAVEEALGRPLGKGEARKIEDSVSLQMRLLGRKDPQAWAALSPQERLQQGAQAAAAAMGTEVRLKQQRLRLQIAVHDRIENALNDAFEKLPDNAPPGEMMRVVSQMLAFDAKGQAMQSAEMAAKAVREEAFSRLLPLWQSVKGVAGLFENQQGIRDLIHELYGEDTGNAPAKAAAQSWKMVTEELRQRANSAGANIGQLEDWNIPQSHSQARVAGAGPDPNAALEKWTEDTLPLLDRSKYIHTDGSRMSDEQMRDFLRNAFGSIVTDGQNKMRPGKGLPGAGIANRGSAHRQIFFKDADSYLTYQGMYGERSLWPTLTGHIGSITRDIGLMETLGPNPEQTFRYFNDRTKGDESLQQPGGKDDINQAASFNEALYDAVSGKTKVVNQKVADRWQSWRNAMVATKLGKVVLTALGDEAGMSATAFANKVPWSESFMREFTYLNPANASDRDTAASSALGLNGMIGGLNRFGSEDLNLGSGTGASAAIRQFTAKLANAVMHASGAEAMWDARRRALGSVLMSYLGKWTREVDNFSDLNAQDHGILTTKGVTENDWQVWKRAQPEDWGMKHGVLTAKSIRDIPDERIDEVIGPKIDAIKADAERQVGDLNQRDEQERSQISQRADALSAWLKEQQDRFSGRVGKGAVFDLKDLEARMSKLQESIEYARSYWKAPVDENTPGIEGQQKVSFYGKNQLRGLGVDEGRAREAIQNIKDESRDIAAEMRRRSGELQEQMYKGFFERQAELKEFTDMAEQRIARRAMVVDRIQSGVDPAIADAREDARRHAATMLLGHVLEETGMGVMDTGARERTRMTFGTTSGTTPGELIRSGLLFKGFSASMMMKHWARAGSMPTGSDTAQYAARLIVAGTVMGALATQLRSVAGGKDPQNIAEPQFWGEAALRGGGLGFYGDFLYSELSSHDTSLIPALVGPLATQSEEAWNLTGAAAFKAARGERTDEGAKLIRFARGNIPFLNMWYTQAAFDHILWNEMQEATSPGYLDRMQAKAYDQKGTTWYWQPGEQLPRTGPDLAKMWQPERGREQLQKIADATGIDKVAESIGAKSD